MEDIKVLFGKKVKELRIKKKLSQEELAEMIDIAERNLSKIECGKSFIRAEKIGKLAQSLNVTPKDLFDFGHQKDLNEIREELIQNIKNDDKNLRILYQLYKIIQ
ncbi:helix-turn-helix transcriptional regulator [bacterium]|nr:helix-turn-helix transcriptional regulator [bacterium]